MAAESAPWTVLRLLNWTKDYLTRSGVQDARLSAEVLLAFVLKCPRIALYTRFDYQPAEQQLAAYRKLVKRAAQSEPVAYLTGEKEFYSLRFIVNAGVLIPRPETEILVSEAVAHLRRLGRPGRMWDVCTGSGCVAVATAAQVADATVLASDLSPQALEVAAQNVQLHKLTERIRTRLADALNLSEDCRDLPPFDAITANPPYVGESDPVAPSVRHEPAAALYAGKDALAIIRRIIADAPQHLAAGGALIMEFGAGQADAVRDLIVAGGAFAEPKILRDQQEIERSVVAIRK